MLVIALAEAVALVAVAALLLRHFQSAQRANARREDLLVNQLCALSGRPWQSPPSWQEEEPEPFDDLEPLQPEQWPD